MKLCIVTPSVVRGDGQGRANYEIIWEAVRRGYQVTLVASKVDQELQNCGQVSWIPISVAQVPTQLLRGMLFSRQSLSWLQQHRQEFDIIQSYGCVTAAPSDVNTVQFVHNGWLRSRGHISRVRPDLYGIYQCLYTALNAYWEVKAFYQAKVIIAVSQNIKQQLLDLKIPQEKIQVIYNGVDIQEFYPGEAQRTALGLPQTETLALFAGDIRTNRKNLDTTLQALVQVRDLHLVVVGATQGSPYPQLSKKLGLSHRVHFLGYRRDMPEIMRAVDLFVFPSRYEPFGMVVSEAMASGLPVITAITTGAAEIVTPDCGIVLSDSEDALALAKALNQLQRDRALRFQMGQAAREVAKHHSWKTKAQEYVDLFEKLSHSSTRSEQLL
jgi:glycosyltransferase involved in cell wall biosynthesis